MPISRYNAELEFNENEWVVSLINTKTDVSRIYGGHAKIVVEGVKRKSDDVFGHELFIAEYHIMEVVALEQAIQNSKNDRESLTSIKQAFCNTKCKYLIVKKEDNKYTNNEEKCKEVGSRSKDKLKPQDVMKMINAIHQEEKDINEAKKEANFQYAGKWCAYSYDGGHNCTTWAEEKLDIIGIGKYLITDSSKAAPYLHVNSGRCTIL